MDRAEFEADLRRDGYRVVNTSVKPNCACYELPVGLPKRCGVDSTAFPLPSVRITFWSGRPHGGPPGSTLSLVTKSTKQRAKRCGATFNR